MRTFQTQVMMTLVGCVVAGGEKVERTVFVGENGVLFFFINFRILKLQKDNRPLCSELHNRVVFQGTKKIQKMNV